MRPYHQIFLKKFKPSLLEKKKNSREIFGIITDGDIRRSLQSKFDESTKSLLAKDIMSINPICINKETLAIKALEIMEDNHKGEITVLPVINDENKIFGLLRLHDLIKAGL